MHHTWGTCKCDSNVYGSDDSESGLVTGHTFGQSDSDVLLGSRDKFISCIWQRHSTGQYHRIVGRSNRTNTGHNILFKSICIDEL